MLTCIMLRIYDLQYVCTPRYTYHIHIATRPKMASNTTTRTKRHNNINIIFYQILLNNYKLTNPLSHVVSPLMLLK